MAVIQSNERVADGIFRMRVAGAPSGHAGQFYMLRKPDALDPFLGRPLSIYKADADAGETSFLYHTPGRGTAMFSAMLPGQTIDAQGPYGNGFPCVDGPAVVIGGGIGIAPLYQLVRELRSREPNRRIDAFLGFQKEAYLTAEFEAIADGVKVNIGGYVTQDVDFSLPATYYACGPAPMLRAAAQAARDARADLYVSLEKRMACGVGACLGCTCRTTGGNKRVCKDGPVFFYEEVFDVI